MAENNEFLREVDEDYRRDRILQIWKRYSGVIIALAVLVVAGVAGWRYWQAQQRAAAEVASVQFDDANRLAKDGKVAEADKAFDAWKRRARRATACSPGSGRRPRPASATPRQAPRSSTSSPTIPAWATACATSRACARPCCASTGRTRIRRWPTSRAWPPAPRSATPPGRCWASPP